MLFGLGVLTSISVLTSCKKDEVTIDSPTVSFQNNEIAYTGTTENDLSRDITITVEAAGKLSIIKIYKVTDSGKTTLKTINDFNSTTQHLFVQTFTIEKNSGVNKFEVEVTDKENNTTSKIFTFTAYSVSAGAITTYTAKLMGAQLAVPGSFFSVSLGDVLTASEAKTNFSEIDLVYYYGGSTNNATIGSPKDTLIQNAHANTNGFTTWTTYNATMFKSSDLTPTQFDAIADDTQMANLTNLSDSHQNNLVAGKVFSFKTVKGKLGFVKVVSVSKNSGAGGSEMNQYQYGTIEIVVKVQK